MDFRGRANRYRSHLKVFFQKRKNDLVYLLVLVGVLLCRVVPPGLGVRMGGWLGGLGYYILRSERRKALAHLMIAYSGRMTVAEQERTAKGCFEHLGKCFVEVVNIPRISGRLDDFVSLDGRQYLDAAMAEGKGVLWITAHLGNWELMACYMAEQGYPLSVIAREANDKRLNRLLLRFREGAAVHVIQRESASSGRQILRVLKEGRILGMLIDQDTKVKGVMADFFGRKANTPSGPAALAVRRSVPVIGGFIHRVSNREHRIVIDPPIEIVRTGDYEHDIQVNTETFNKIIEQHIRQAPEQWVWVHRRWRRPAAYDPAMERPAAAQVS